MLTIGIRIPKLTRFLVAGLWAGLAIAPAQPQADSRRAVASALAAVERGRTTDAELAKASAVTRDHPSEAAWCRLGDAFMQKSRETSDTSYYVEAGRAYRNALAANPKSADAMAGIAWVESERRRFESSIEWAQKALAIDSKRADVYGLLGDAALEMGDNEKALDYYQQMLDIKPAVSSYSRAAQLLFLTGNLKKATLLMTKAIGSSTPDSDDAAWCRAQWALMHFAQGSYLSAAQILTAGLSAAPANYHLLAAMGKVKAALKDYPAAIDYYKRAQAIAPQFDVAVAVGDIYTVQGKTQDAAVEYLRAEQIHNRNRKNGVIDDMELARFFVDHDRNLEDALTLAEAAYRTRANVYSADTLAWCYYKNSRLPEAKKFIIKATSHNTPEASFLYHKGVIFAKSGETAGARTALYQALSLSPNFDPLTAPIAVKLVQEFGSTPPAGGQ